MIGGYDYSNGHFMGEYSPPSTFMGPGRNDWTFTTQTLPLPPVVADRPPKLYFTIGAQRSGKSTLGRKWLRRECSLTGEADDGYPRAMWDSDLLRLALHGERYNWETEPMVFAIKNYAIRALLATGSDVVCAGTHTSRASIRRLLEIRRDAIPVLIDTPEEECIRRAVKTDQEDLIPAIRKTRGRVDGIKLIGVDLFVETVRRDMDQGAVY